MLVVGSMKVGCCCLGFGVYRMFCFRGGVVVLLGDVVWFAST